MLQLVWVRLVFSLLVFAVTHSSFSNNNWVAGQSDLLVRVCGEFVGWW